MIGVEDASDLVPGRGDYFFSGLHGRGNNKYYG